MSLSGSAWEWPPPGSTSSWQGVCDGTSVLICPGTLGHSLSHLRNRGWGGELCGCLYPLPPRLWLAEEAPERGWRGNREEGERRGGGALEGRGWVQRPLEERGKRRGRDGRRGAVGGGREEGEKERSGRERTGRGKGKGGGGETGRKGGQSAGWRQFSPRGSSRVGAVGMRTRKPVPDTPGRGRSPGRDAESGPRKLPPTRAPAPRAQPSGHRASGRIRARAESAPARRRPGSHLPLGGTDEGGRAAAVPRAPLAPGLSSASFSRRWSCCPTETPTATARRSA